MQNYGNNLTHQVAHILLELHQYLAQDDIANFHELVKKAIPKEGSVSSVAASKPVFVEEDEEEEEEESDEEQDRSSLSVTSQQASEPMEMDTEATPTPEEEDGWITVKSRKRR